MVMTEKFTLSNGKEVKVSVHRNGTSSVMLNGNHYKYKVIVEVNNITKYFNFHDSIANYISGAYPIVGECLGCVLMDAFDYYQNSNPQDFANEFGYEIGTREFVRAYNGCEKAYYKMLSMLSLDEMYELYDFLAEKGYV